MPLFTSYLFVHYMPSTPWTKVSYVEGVKSILGAPTMLRYGEVEKIAAVTAINGVIEAGTNVEVSAGAFAGKHALVTMDKGTRVKLLLSLLGQEVELEFSKQQVRRV